jgi:hypothetical protein
MPSILRLSLAAALAVGTSLPAMAQSYEDQAQYQQRLQDYQAQKDQYDAQQDQYRSQQQDYENRSAAAQPRRDTYAVQRDDYSANREAYERERADYDARYGSGAWDRRYGYGYSYRRQREDDYYRPYVASACERGSNAAAGGVIGALAGAAIGSNVAGRGDRTAGAVLGAVAGGAVGASIASNTAHCDRRGYYFSYDQTYPYRELPDRADGRFDRYHRRGCRLAQAPAYVRGQTEYRYVRVCPDADGRFRFEG